MQHSDPYDRVTGRGWVVSGEGEAEILPGTGRGTIRRMVEGACPTAQHTGGSAETRAPSTVFDGPPPRSGEDFTPDPVFTPALKLRFLDELSGHGNVRVAAGRVGVSRSGAYLARRRDAAFVAERLFGGVEITVELRTNSAEVIALMAGNAVQLSQAHIEGYRSCGFFRLIC